MSANWQHGSTFVDPLMASCGHRPKAAFWKTIIVAP